MNATQLGLTDLAMLLGPDHPGAEVCMTANKEIDALRAEVERLREALRVVATMEWEEWDSDREVNRCLDPQCDAVKGTPHYPGCRIMRARAALEEKP